MEILTYTIAGASLLTFILFALDKMFAKMNAWRIPEAVLLWLAFLGGAAGALAAMNLFHHKTEKKRFTKTIPFMLILHIALLLVFIYI